MINFSFINNTVENLSGSDGGGISGGDGSQGVGDAGGTMSSNTDSNTTTNNTTSSTRTSDNTSSSGTNRSKPSIYVNNTLRSSGTTERDEESPEELDEKMELSEKFPTIKVAYPIFGAPMSYVENDKPAGLNFKNMDSYIHVF